MATLEQLGSALINADAAGDIDAARMLAAEITRMRNVAPAQPPMQTEAAPSYDAMGLPTGGMDRAPIQANMPYADQMSKVGTALDQGVRMVANGMTFGLADKFAGGMDALTGRAKSYDEGVKAQRATTQGLRNASPAAAGVAEAAGGLAGGLGLVNSGVTLAGRGAQWLLPRVLKYGVEGGAYGAAHGAGNTYSDKVSDYIRNAKDSATIGVLIGSALPIAGTAAGAGYRLGSAFFGPRVEGLGRGASAMLRGAAQADEAGLRALPSMGPEAMLVDAGPAMRGLGQGAGTGTGEGRSALVNALKARDDRTGERLARSLDENLGPSPTPSQIEANLSGNRAFVGLDYEPLLQGAGPVNTRNLAAQLDAMAIAERGPAQRAARQVREMLNDPVATRELDRNPAALLNSRQAIDGLLANEVDPNTIRVLTQARAAVDGELARSVPGIKAVDAQIAESSRQSTALQRGSQVLDTGKTAVRPGELFNEIRQSAIPQGEMIGPSAAPLRLRQGTRAEMDRLVGTNVNDLNALERKIGTPQDWNSQKLGTVFGEGPRDRVTEGLMNNRKFRQAYQDIVQNSQTAQRQEAAKAMRGAEGGNVPHDTTATALGLRALNLVSKAISGASNARTKDEIGRVLASEGPDVQRIASRLLQSAAATGQNSRAIFQVMASPYWISASTPAVGRKSKQ